MKSDELLGLLSTLEKLKCNTRHCWTSTGLHETVAAHSWSLATLAMLVSDEFPELDMNKVVRMCLIHDWGEAITGDIPSFDKTEADEKRENLLLAEFVSGLPEPWNGELVGLYDEMDRLETSEARLYKTLDKMEAVIQHNEAPLTSWLPLERELNLTYGEENALQFPYTAKLREEIRRRTREKLDAEEKSAPVAQVRLTDITAENWERVICLTTNNDPRIPWGDYVASNAYSIVQSVYEKGWTVKAIEADGETVGFTMYGYIEQEDIYELCRFMVGTKYQGRGIGRRALGLIVDTMRRDLGCGDIYLSTGVDNGRGYHLYQSFGFVDTGKLDGNPDGDDAEEIFVLKGEPQG